jgi:hypothetical protein
VNKKDLFNFFKEWAQGAFLGACSSLLSQSSKLLASVLYCACYRVYHPVVSDQHTFDF